MCHLIQPKRIYIDAWCKMRHEMTQRNNSFRNRNVEKWQNMQMYLYISYYTYSPRNGLVYGF